MVAEDKLTAEGGLAETKVILGWHFNFRTLTVSLYIAWSGEINTMLDRGRTTKKALELTIGLLDFPEYNYSEYNYSERIPDTQAQSTNTQSTNTQSTITQSTNTQDVYRIPRGIQDTFRRYY